MTKETMSESEDGIRLQKVLAQAGVGSRRACEELIDEGRVEVDGTIVLEQGLRVDPKRQVIKVDGMRIPTAPGEGSALCGGLPQGPARAAFPRGSSRFRHRRPAPADH